MRIYVPEFHWDSIYDRKNKTNKQTNKQTAQGHLKADFSGVLIAHGGIKLNEMNTECFVP